MASEAIECQDVVLRVAIHCQGCKKKVKKVLQNISGVYRCEIDARSNKVVATVSTKLDPYMLVAKLRKSGKQAELWPEQPPPPPAAALSQTQEPKNNQPDETSKPSEPAEKRGADTAAAAAAEPSNPPEPKQSTSEAPNPAPDSKENASADDAVDDTAAAPAQHGPSEAKGKAKAMQQPEMERQPVDARVTVEYDRGVPGYVNRMPVPPPAVMSYNQVRPSVSASYYAPAPAPAPAPMPMARPGPSQGYIDEHYTPSYYNNYNRSPAYEPEPYYYSPPQPAPYSYQYQYQPASSSEDYYYSAPPPQRSAFSPPRDGYGDMFNDESANSCTVM
ncbi:heavy metal-associated isoprenylated plant protein 35-like isoform X1 [Miscanthus floridulus]|uniref:heavy metal-associated isoprenylated plant protein 35-like isoform X1 n=2 Tax=Miscanthus floridulus TaxID=154761 RepID=UPI0034580BB3